MQPSCASRTPPRRWTGALAVVAAVGAAALGLAACGGGSSPSSSSSSSTPSLTGSGCGKAASAGSSTLHWQLDGHDRTVIVHVPDGYVDGDRHALVLNLHGSGSDALGQELFSGMDATSDADGFLVVYPQGLLASGTGFDWNVPDEPLVGGALPPSDAADDVTFLVTLVHALEARYCVDADRVDVTGMSGGARMASQLACDASGTFAAVAAVSGLRAPTPCPAGRAVPILAFHGTDDHVDPYGGDGEAYWTYSVPTAAKDWARRDGCEATPTTTSGAGYTVTAYGRCAHGSQVELYTLAGEGHEWPGGPVMPASLVSVLGPQSDAVDADAVMWAFFEAHPLP